MCDIKNLLKDLSDISLDIKIDAITNDSRAVTKNTLFLAYKGEKSDGRNYISQAVEKGACAICYEPSDDFVLPTNTIPCIAINDLKIKQSLIAARFYDFPSTKIPVIGVTGTNGKTSVTHFIAQILNEKCGIIGTIGYGFLPQLKKTINTTPDGVQLQSMFSELIAEGAKAIAMEVSSHALHQQRVNDVQFHTAVFTNLTQDHLDYHITMDNYRDAKELLFQQPHLKNAVINVDDAVGYYFAEKYRKQLKVITYSKNNKSADIFVINKTTTADGFDLKIQTPWGSDEFHLPLIGEFNIENVLAVIGVVGSMHQSYKRLSELRTVDGRMQLLKSDNSPTIVVDYAHTPDALEKALQSIRAHCSGKLICVFGCGGNRDKTKRSKMGLIADQLADHVIITNDNPRNEEPEAIAKEILAGAKNSAKFEMELNRVKAIENTIKQANKNDWILIAGKGHETEQIIGNAVSHHSDVECVLSLLK